MKSPQSYFGIDEEDVNLRGLTPFDLRGLTRMALT